MCTGQSREECIRASGTWCVLKGSWAHGCSTEKGRSSLLVRHEQRSVRIVYLSLQMFDVGESVFTIRWEIEPPSHKSRPDMRNAVSHACLMIRRACMSIYPVQPVSPLCLAWVTSFNQCKDTDLRCRPSRWWRVQPLAESHVADAWQPSGSKSVRLGPQHASQLPIEIDLMHVAHSFPPSQEKEAKN